MAETIVFRFAWIVATVAALSVMHNEVPSDKPAMPCITRLQRLDILPGHGWDCLRNKEMAQIMDNEYISNKTTMDGRYFIPDNVKVAAVKESNILLKAEVITHWINYSSLTDTGIQASADFSYASAGIKGSFSKDYLAKKKSQVESHSVTMRSYARYNIYKVSIAIDAELHPRFEERLLKAVDQLKNNQTVRYSLELLVKDYGTHFLDEVTAGGMIVMESSFSKEYDADDNQQRRNLQAAATAAFYNFLNAGLSGHSSENQSQLNDYTENVLSHEMRCVGGAPLKTNTSLDLWAETVEGNLATVDRSGRPLYDLVSSTMLPNIDPELLQRLSEELKTVIDAYYKYNTHTGCTNPDSPNFNYVANVDDHSCLKQFRNHTFGGAFQTLMLQPGDDADGYLWQNLTRPNPLTGNHTCPEGFLTVPLRRVSVERIVQRRICTEHNWYGGCKWSNKSRLVQGHYEAFWCVAPSPVESNSGAMFGGVYTSDISNPLTGSKSCPPTFIAVTILTDLHLCIGLDYGFGFQHSVDFGGFFSCSAGNPLSSAYNKSSFGAYSHSCGGGYSQHVAYITHDNCIISYCMRSKDLAPTHNIEIVLPPFTSMNHWIGLNLFATNGQSHQAISGAVLQTAALFIVVMTVTSYLIVLKIVC